MTNFPKQRYLYRTKDVSIFDLSYLMKRENHKHNIRAVGYISFMKQQQIAETSGKEIEEQQGDQPLPRTNTT